ncbi:MAG TPA: type II and III secretion system protein family protein [Caulobacteraceae bacterium]|jgi:pilus assembly protein CpaC|nr:type II and III secretion system protein family protein [Caulobacteraceae bacterium]
MKPRHRLLALAALLIASLSQAAVPALAQMQPPMGPVAGPMPVNLAGVGGAAQNLTIPRGKSAIVDLPVDARDVLVTNPQVADAVLRSPRRIYVMGLAPGVTDAAFFDAAGRRILALNIRVDQDFSAVAQTINQLIPDAHVRVAPVNTSLVLTGDVRDLAEADRAVQIAQQFTSNPAQVLNMMTIDGKEQVMLKVRIVEMQRTVIKQLGFNLSALIGQAGSPQFLLGTAASFAVNGAILGGLNAGYQLDTTQQPQIKAWDPLTKAFDLPQVCSGCNNGGQGTIATTQTTSGSTGVNKANTTIEAFEQVGLVRTLAEPNLTAISGESAKFLAGGEFPVPSGISSNGQVSVDFKTFGVGLGFTPVVLSAGRISLKISTEVSELTNQGSFTLATGSGSGGSTTGSAALTIPGLNVRRAETTVELPSGGSMMIAGLLNEETKQDIASLPGMMNLPVLGALFNSRDYQEGETELVVIVTPYLVTPTSPANLQTPADGFVVANDAQTTLLGRLNKVYKAPPAAVAGRTYQGPVGYVIE